MQIAIEAMTRKNNLVPLVTLFGQQIDLVSSHVKTFASDC